MGDEEIVTRGSFRESELFRWRHMGKEGSRRETKMCFKGRGGEAGTREDKS